MIQNFLIHLNLNQKYNTLLEASHDAVSQTIKSMGCDVLINELCINFCSMELKAKEIKKYQKVKEKYVLTLLEKEYNKPSEYNVKVNFNCGFFESTEKIGKLKPL